MTEFKVPPGSTLNVDLRRKQKPKAQAPARKEDETGLITAEGDLTRYVFRDEDSVIICDLGARLVGDAPYSYRELELFYPVSYDVSHIDATDFGDPSILLTEAQWTAIDEEFLAGDPFDYTTVGGRRMPNVLALNRDAPLGQVPLDFYVGDDYFGTPYPLNVVGENEFWRWQARELSPEGWSPDVTGNDLAPQAGRYVKKKAKKYSSFYLQDYLRFWDWPFGLPEEDSWVYLTEEPSPEAALVNPPLKFPLRVFGVPALWRFAESSSVRALTQAGGDILGGADANYGLAIVQEYSLNFSTRLPQIPLPGKPADLEWLVKFPSSALRTLRRVSTWHSTDSSGFPALGETISWELIVGRRPKSQAEVIAEATELSQGETVGNMGDTFLTENPDAADWVNLSTPPRHLYGAVEVAGKVYYVWRA